MVIASPVPQPPEAASPQEPVLEPHVRILTYAGQRGNSQQLSDNIHKHSEGARCFSTPHSSSIQVISHGTRGKMYVYDSPYCTTNEGEGVFAIEFGRDEKKILSRNFNSILVYQNVQNVAQI